MLELSLPDSHGIETFDKLFSAAPDATFDLRTSMTWKVFFVLPTFGDSARHDDQPWGEHYTAGRSGVGLSYQQLMKALPDLEIEVLRRYVTGRRHRG